MTLRREYRRSPFLVGTWLPEGFALIHGDTLRHFRVDSRLIELLSTLQEWRRAEDIEFGGKEVKEAHLMRLADLGVLETRDDAHDPDCQPNYWDPVDLVVQRRHNTGGYREDVVRARGDPPPPAFKSPPEGPSFALPQPRSIEVPFDQVLASRRSVRTFGDRMLTLEDVSSVLYHSARVAGTLFDPLLGEHAFRPYGAGGGRSEAEIYVIANEIEDLSQGAYYFDARAHCLIRIKERDEGQDRINGWVRTATGGSINKEPQAILLITAVFARIMWKYQGIGLSTILRNVGSLYQTLYLTATGLGLAPCGIGGGPEVANARWLGLDPLQESQVGAFLLGTKRDGDRPISEGAPEEPWLR